MGLFAPKISPQQLQVVQNTMNQLQDSINLINTTYKPDVFFKRLNFTLDLLLLLQTYEKYRIFKGSTPTDDYRRIISDMSATVDSFIDRAYAEEQRTVSSLKTESAKRRHQEKFATALIAAFDCANSFWTGNIGYPHYTGRLFSENNYCRVREIYNNISHSE